MAVDYHHYLVVTGPSAAVSAFARRIALVATRRVAGVARQTTVPFSFESLYALARMGRDAPCDPYGIRRWRIPARQGAAAVRYRFHTRNLEMPALLRKLSRATPQLRFALVTHCLDDSSFGAWTFVKGRRRGGWLNEEWHESFWKRAAEEYGLDLDAAYEEPAAEETAEDMMLDDAVRRATGTPRQYDWYSGRVYRPLAEEREKQIAELRAEMERQEAGTTGKSPPSTGRRRKLERKGGGA